MTALAAEGLGVTLGGRKILHDVEFVLEPGDFCALVGPNGAGKTTLIRALAGILPADEGRVLLDREPLSSLPPLRRARELAYLPQGGEAVWPVAVQDLVMLGRLPHRRAFAGPDDKDRQVVERVMAAMHVDGLAHRPATELSGGERARVLLARALAGEPKILLADEPVVGLDPYHALDVMERLGAMARNGAAVLVVLHDLTLAARFCSRAVLLDRGRVAEDGEPRTSLAPARIAEVYGVEAVAGSHDGEPYILPWRRL